MWNSAFRAKFESSDPSSPPPFTRIEWDQLLGHCMAITDSPSVFFHLELMSAYPNAKILLTTRDVDEYYKSFMATLWPFGLRYCVPTWNPYRLLFRWLLPYTALAEMNVLLYKYGHGNDFPTTGKERYSRHNERIRQLCKEQGRELLEFDVSQGWEPLCRYLGKKVPDTPFPQSNSTESFNAYWEPMHRMLEGTVYMKMAVLASGLVGIGSLMYLRLR